MTDLPVYQTRFAGFPILTFRFAKESGTRKRSKKKVINSSLQSYEGSFTFPPHIESVANAGEFFLIHSLLQLNERFFFHFHLVIDRHKTILIDSKSKLPITQWWEILDNMTENCSSPYYKFVKLSAKKKKLAHVYWPLLVNIFLADFNFPFFIYKFQLPDIKQAHIFYFPFCICRN